MPAWKLSCSRPEIGLGAAPHTVVAGGVPVDRGGAWILDPAGNPLTPFVEQLGLDWRSDAMWGNEMCVFTAVGWVEPHGTSTLASALTTSMLGKLLMLLTTRVTDSTMGLTGISDRGVLVKLEPISWAASSDR